MRVLAGLLILAAAGCSPVGNNERLWVEGTLERFAPEDNSAVEVSYLSEGARGEWWPCDLRLTAQGCLGEHHVNVYIGLGGLGSVDEIGRAGCVVDGRAFGAYEVIAERRAGEYTLGADLSAFVVIASNTDDVAGADFASDDETTAVSQVQTGTLTVDRYRGLDAIGLTIDGTTREGNAVHIEFNGPTTTPSVVPLLDDNTSCVASALVQ